MLTLAGMITLALVAMAVFVVVALVGVLLKVVFRLALLPITLGVGLLKFLLLPLLALAGVILLVVLGPVLLTVAAVLFVPLALLGALAWTGVRVAGAVL